MNLESRILLVVAMCSIFAQAVVAQTCPFVITTSADSITDNCTHVTGDTWDIDIALTHSTQSATLDITVGLAGGNRPSIRDLTIRVNRSTGVYPNITLTIIGSTAPFNLLDLASMTIDSSTERNILLEIQAFGSIGYMQCHGILMDSIILGDVTDAIRLLPKQGCFPCPSIVEELQVDGDFLGDFTVTATFAETNFLTVTGDIGTALAPVDFSGAAGVDWGDVTCTNFYGDFRAG